jgi:hypothetical protein
MGALRAVCFLAADRSPHRLDKPRPSPTCGAPFGSFTRTRPAGADRFTFTGRLTGHPLKPGRYRLVATPTANRHTGKPARAGFRILK